MTVQNGRNPQARLHLQASHLPLSPGFDHYSLSPCRATGFRRISLITFIFAAGVEARKKVTEDLSLSLNFVRYS